MSEPNEGAAEAVTEDVAAIDPAAEVEAAAPAEEGDPGDDAAAATDEPAPKPRRSVQERIDEAVKAQREAERDREYWREQALRNQAPQPKAETPSEDAEPDPSDYEHGELDVRFIRDHATFHAKRTFREETAKQTAERERAERLTAFENTTKAAAEKHTDFFEVVGRDYGKAAALCTSAMQEAILSSDVGGELAYHLATNPGEARRIAALDPISQVRMLGRLEGQLSAPAKTPPKTATDAPAPTPQVRGQGGRFTVPPDTDDFAAFEKQFGS